MLGDIDYFLRDLSRGVRRISDGQIPDGSGNPLPSDPALDDFFFLPGRFDGQLGYGSTQAGGLLRFSSTANEAKGFIHLGDPTASLSIDESLGFVGIAKSAPAARLHIRGGGNSSNLIPTASVVNNWTENGVVVPGAIQTNDGDTTYVAADGGGVVLECRQTLQEPAVMSAVTSLTVRWFMKKRDVGGGVRTATLRIAHDGSSPYQTIAERSVTLTDMTQSYVDYSFTLSASELTDFKSRSVHYLVLLNSSNVDANQIRVTQAIAEITTGSAPDSDLVRWESTDTTALGKLNSAGRLGINTGSATLGAGATFISDAAASIVSIFKGAASQSGNLTEWQNSAGTILSRIKSDGTFDGPIAGTITFATIADANFSIFDDATPTKIAKFQCSSITAANTRTFTFPDYNGFFAVPVNEGTSGQFLRSAGAGVQPTWATLSSTSLSVTDNLFSILDDATPSKIAQFQCASLTAGTNTFTFPNTTAGTFAMVNLAQTFTLAQTITPTSGTALTLNAPTGVNPVLVSSYTDTAFVGAGSGTAFAQLKNGLWTLSPTLSNASSILDNVLCLAIAPSISNLAGSGVNALAAGLHLYAKFGLDATDDGSMTVLGLRFFAETQGASGSTFSSVVGALGGASHVSTDAVTTATGVQGNVQTTAGAGTITTANCFATGGAIATAVTSYRGLRINNPTGTGTITTATGISIASITRGTTNYAIDSAGGQSRHVGNFYFGAATNPTAKVHIAAGTTAASTAPIKLTSGSLMSATEAGAVEFLTDDLFYTLTTGTARRRLTNSGGPVDLTAQVADITTTNLLASPPAGMYEVEIVLMCTTAAAAAGPLTVTIGWTDNVGATTTTPITGFALTATGRTAASQILRVSSSNITYAVAVTGIYSTAAYAIYLRTVSLG
jgi:hypothetical protein